MFLAAKESNGKTKKVFTKRESFVSEGISHFLNIATYFFMIFQQVTWNFESLMHSSNFFFSLLK